MLMTAVPTPAAVCSLPSADPGGQTGKRSMLRRTLFAEWCKWNQTTRNLATSYEWFDAGHEDVTPHVTLSSVNEGEDEIEIVVEVLEFSSAQRKAIRFLVAHFFSSVLHKLAHMFTTSTQGGHFFLLPDDLRSGKFYDWIWRNYPASCFILAIGRRIPACGAVRRPPRGSGWTCCACCLNARIEGCL